MIEEYRLDKTELPILPCPHDCEIKDVNYDDSFLTFVFEDDISQYDSIQHIRPQSVSLIIRYHLIHPDLVIYRAIQHVTRWGKRFGRIGYYLVDNNYLKMTDKLEYLGHWIDYKSILIVLCSEDCGSIIVNAAVDYVEYEWIDN